MSLPFAVNQEVTLDGTRVDVDVGEMTHCFGEVYDNWIREGVPVAVVARLRSNGWDVEEVTKPQYASAHLGRYDRRDGISGLAAVFDRVPRVWYRLNTSDTADGIVHRRRSPEMDYP